MAFPFAAIPLVGKALTALKGGSALKAAAGFGAGLPKSAAAAKVMSGMPGAAMKTATGKARMAGEALKKAATEKANIKYLKDNYGVDVGGTVRDVMGKGPNMLSDVGKFFVNNAGDTRTEVALRLAPDLAFGTLAGVMTPGDLGDKVIAGTAQAAGGALGGIGAAGLAKKMGASPGIATLADMGGSIAGDFVGMATADNLMRAKGGGLTPYEKMALEQEEMMRRQMAAEMYGGDPFMATNGLA